MLSNTRVAVVLNLKFHVSVFYFTCAKESDGEEEISERLQVVASPAPFHPRNSPCASLESTCYITSNVRPLGVRKYNESRGGGMTAKCSPG